MLPTTCYQNHENPLAKDLQYQGRALSLLIVDCPQNEGFPTESMHEDPEI